MTCVPVGLFPADPVAEGRDRDRHFHQLFRLLRLTENRTRKAGWPGDLGHCENLRGNLRIDELDQGQPAGPPSATQVQQETAPSERRRQAAPCRCACSCGRGSAKASGRTPLGSSSNNLKSSRWGGWGLLSSWRVVFVVPLLPGPGHLRSPWGGMMRHLGQGHGDGHPLMSQP